MFTSSRLHTQLHSLSSVVLYDISFKKPRGKLYDVKRIIERRKTRYVSFSLCYLFHELLKDHFARIGLTWVSFAGLRRVYFTALTRVYFPCLFNRRVYFIGRLQRVRRVYFAVRAENSRSLQR